MTQNKPPEKTTGSRMKELHAHYRERGFYKYVGRNVLLIILVYIALVFLFFLTGKYLVDFNSFFQGLIDSFSDRFVIILFFVSESFTGLVPVDLFVVWTQKFEHHLPYLVMLGISASGSRDGQR
jgi:hypothetical protein